MTFESLVKSFLYFLQLPVHHETGLEILFEFKQIKTIHIVDHIHEWRRRRRIHKVDTTPQQRLD